jgi:hypothetical protein
MEEGWRRLIDEQWLRDCMEDWCDYGHLIVRAKWTMDGATTLAEAARAFRERAVARAPGRGFADASC